MVALARRIPAGFRPGRIFLSGIAGFPFIGFTNVGVSRQRCGRIQFGGIEKLPPLHTAADGQNLAGDVTRDMG